jgi:hypothetical protein
MYNDIYRSAAEDNVKEMRKRATEHQLYVNVKKGKKPGFPKRLFGFRKGA